MLPARLLCLFFTIGLLLLPRHAVAGTLTAEDLMDMPLERLVKVEVLVTGASKYAEKVNEAPSIVEIITAEDIRTYGWKTLGDAINGLHGIYTSNDRNFTTVGVRGFVFTSYSDSRILVMVDGQRMNENTYDAAYVGEEFMVDMGIIDHIEYIPGPGSSIYGANAMMGVINVVTKKGSDIAGTELELGGGTLGTGRARGTFGKKLENGANVLLSVSRYSSHGDSTVYFPEFDDPSTNNGIAQDLDSENAERLFGKAEYGDFTYTAGYVNRYREVPTALYGTLFNEQGNDGTDRHAYGEVKYNTQLNDKTQLDAKASYHWYRSKLNYPYDLLGTYILSSEYIGDWAGAEATMMTTAFNRQTIVLGAEFQFDIEQKLYDYDKFGVYQDTHRSGFRSGLYAQDAIRLTDALVLNVGLRLDQHHMLDKLQINPRLGLIWNPRASTTMKLLYGSAFRAPNAYERDYDAFFSWTANPNNKEERIRNLEAQVEWRSENGLKLTGGAVYNEFLGMLNKNYDATSPFYHMYVNSGHLRSLGFEIGAEKKWDDGREFKLSFNHTEYLKHIGTAWGAVDDPKNVAKLRYAQPLFGDRAKLGLEDIYVGKRTTLYYNTEDGYNIVNANVTSSNLVEGIDTSFGVYNLFDSEKNSIGGAFVTEDVIPLYGRTVMLTFRKTF